MKSASSKAVNGTRGRIFSSIPEWNLRLYEQSTAPGAEYSAQTTRWGAVDARVNPPLNLKLKRDNRQVCNLILNTSFAVVKTWKHSTARYNRKPDSYWKEKIKKNIEGIASTVPNNSDRKRLKPNTAFVCGVLTSHY
jgi:hypothetical protein